MARYIKIKERHKVSHTINLQAFLDHPYIRHQRHPALPYVIFNYTEACQYGKMWDEYTTQARGLILDERDGSVVARPFAKFMNLGESTETMPENLPHENPIVTEKLDGSLGVLYFDGDDPCIATRGSFVSDQAKWATNWLMERGFKRGHFGYGITYLFEIIYPENRVVLNYGSRAELVLLALIDNRTGRDLESLAAGRGALVEYEAKVLRLNHANFYPFVGIGQLKTLTKELKGQEGYVLSYSNGLRVKVKSDEYVRLHKIISGLSEKTIFEIVSKGGDFSHIPDEWFAWANELKQHYIYQFHSIEAHALQIYADVKSLPSRKEQAMYLNKNYKDMASIVFAILDNKDFAEAIWRKVEPKVKSENKQLVSEGE